MILGLVLEYSYLKVHVEMVANVREIMLMSVINCSMQYAASMHLIESESERQNHTGGRR